jgi:hypothetical protein
MEFTFFTKLATLTRRSNVLGLSTQLAFPDITLFITIIEMRSNSFSEGMEFSIRLIDTIQKRLRLVLSISTPLDLPLHSAFGNIPRVS